MGKFRIGPTLISILASFLITVIFIWFSLNPPHFANTLIKRLDFIAYDMRLNLLMPKNARPHNPIVIVDIDEKSLQAEGRWPWPRDKVAALIKALYDQGVTVIAFDMLFPESENDNTLANTLREGKNKIVLGVFFSNQKNAPAGVLPKPAVENINYLPPMQSYIGNLAVLQNAAENAGAISVVPDEDGVIRHYNLLQRYGNNTYPSLALEAIRLYLLENNITVDTSKIGDQDMLDNINLGNTKIHTDGEGRVFIPYLGPSGTFPYYSASDVLEHKIPNHQLQNALVFLGTSAVGLGDMRSTPVQSVFPGVEIHANMAEALFANKFPYVPAWAPGAELSLLILLGIVLSLLFTFIGPLWIILTSIISLGAIFFGSLWMWSAVQIVFPIILPLFLIIILATFNMTYGFFVESKRKEELKKVFEQYVPPQRVAEIISHPEAANIFEGERKVMSVLFMDIRNFTTISEKLSIVELKKLLNFVLTEMTSVIFKHNGTIDKYVGDMVMAFWGAPLNDADHAKHAILSGLEMVNRINEIQEKLSEMKLPNIRVGVGINTGIMDVGDMGSTYRRAYSVLGDAVNLASRLESLTKYYGVNIICGESTVENQDEFIFRLLDKVKVKGKQEGISIYEPLGLRANILPEKITGLTAYEDALENYYAKNFVKARELFNNLKDNYPTVILYQMYLSRIEEYLNTPPPSDWDGVWEHHEK